MTLSKVRGASPQTPTQAVEKLVRGRNKVYLQWRKRFRFTTLDTYCAECLMRFGTLPHWREYPVARQCHHWKEAIEMATSQRKWRSEIRRWCRRKGITTFNNESAQFYKFYSAWYRYKQEQENGPTLRPFARQMY